MRVKSTRPKATPYEYNFALAVTFDIMVAHRANVYAHQAHVRAPSRAHTCSAPRPAASGSSNGAESEVWDVLDVGTTHNRLDFVVVVRLLAKA